MDGKVLRLSSTSTLALDGASWKTLGQEEKARFVGGPKGRAKSLSEGKEKIGKKRP